MRGSRARCARPASRRNVPAPSRRDVRTRGHRVSLEWTIGRHSTALRVGLSPERRVPITSGRPRPPFTEIAMRKLNGWPCVPLAMLAVACGRSGSPAVDDALKNDLALASQAQPYNPQQFVSPTEQRLRGAAAYAPQNAPDRRAPPVAAAPVRRTSTARRSSGQHRASAAVAYYPAPAPPTRS